MSCRKKGGDEKIWEGGGCWVGGKEECRQTRGETHRRKFKNEGKRDGGERRMRGGGEGIQRIK